MRPLLEKQLMWGALIALVLALVFCMTAHW